MPSKPTRYEKTKAKQHRGKHIGGPGKPDYTRGNTVGEVKNRKTPVTGPELQKMIERGVGELDTMGGITGPGLDLAKQKGITVFSRGKKLA